MARAEQRLLSGKQPQPHSGYVDMEISSCNTAAAPKLCSGTGTGIDIGIGIGTPKRSTFIDVSYVGDIASARWQPV